MACELIFLDNVSSVIGILCDKEVSIAQLSRELQL
jgi:hypothetical protein